MATLFERITPRLWVWRPGELSTGWYTKEIDLDRDTLIYEWADSRNSPRRDWDIMEFFRRVIENGYTPSVRGRNARR